MHLPIKGLITLIIFGMILALGTGSVWALSLAEIPQSELDRADEIEASYEVDQSPLGLVYTVMSTISSSLLSDLLSSSDTYEISFRDTETSLYKAGQRAFRVTVDSAPIDPNPVVINRFLPAFHQQSLTLGVHHITITDITDFSDGSIVIYDGEVLVSGRIPILFEIGGCRSDQQCQVRLKVGMEEMFDSKVAR